MHKPPPRLIRVTASEMMVKSRPGAVPLVFKPAKPKRRRVDLSRLLADMDTAMRVAKLRADGVPL